MLYVNRAAGGLALILLLSLLVTSCQSLVFGRLAQAAEPAWAHVVVGHAIAKQPDADGRYRVRVYFCCISIDAPMDCTRNVRGIEVPKHIAEAYAGNLGGIPYAWRGAHLAATQACRDLT